MPLAEIENLLKRTMGLDSASVGVGVIRRAIRERIARRGLESPAAYLALLQQDEGELQELIENVVVPETWFFRDREAFSALAQLAQERHRRQPQAVMRLLSLPCATGEEPYSMVMTLLDAGLPPEAFVVDAIDISAQALAKARAALYGKNSFRGGEENFRARYFDGTAQGWRLREPVRRKVGFRRGNLFEPGLLPEAATYDVVFCRNVLIYFDAVTQERAVAVLTRLLKPEGLFFVGASESALLLRPEYAALKLPMAFVFRKLSVPPLQPGAAAALPSAPKASAARTPPHRPTVPSAARPAAATPPARNASMPLEEAQRLANQGRLTEAAQLCEQQLRQQGPSAAAFHLLGLVHDASGNPDKADYYYRKALYLEPAHHEALIHLAVLLEKQGDSAGARLLHERARRQLSEGQPGARPRP